MKKLSIILTAFIIYLVTATATYLYLTQPQNTATYDQTTLTLFLAFEAIATTTPTVYFLGRAKKKEEQEIAENANEIEETGKVKLVPKPTPEEITIKQIEAQRQKLLKAPSEQIQQTTDDGYREEPEWNPQLETPTSTQAPQKKPIKTSQTKDKTLEEIYEEQQKLIVVAASNNIIRRLDRDELLAKPVGEPLKKFGATHFDIVIEPTTIDKKQTHKEEKPITISFPEKKGLPQTPEEIAKAAGIPTTEIANGKPTEGQKQK